MLIAQAPLVLAFTRLAPSSPCTCLPVLAARRGSSAIATEPVDAALSVLRQCASVSSKPTPEEATQALARVANAGVHPEDWRATLSASSWRPVFSAKPDALKAAAADASAVSRPPATAAAPPGRFLSVDAVQSFSRDGRVENSFRLLWGFARLGFCGAFNLSGRRMTITFETLRVVLLFGLVRFGLDLRDGSRLRRFVERWVRPRGAQAAGKPFKKRPNVYAWCYADDGLCVAQGSSGSVAVWAADGASAALTTPAADPPLAGTRAGTVRMRLAPRAARRARPPAMLHSAEELQLAAALVLPLLAYKTAAIVQRVQLQWYLDASIALATASLLAFAAS